MSFLMMVFARRHGLPWVRGLLVHVMKMAGAAAIMGGVSLAVLAWTHEAFAGMPAAETLALFSTLGVATGTYLLICWLLRVPELSDVLSAALLRRQTRKL